MASGNRSPIVFVAHSFLYAFTASDASLPLDSRTRDNPNTLTAADRDARWKALTDFVTYALSKPEVRIRPVKDVLAWVHRTSGSTSGPGAAHRGIRIDSSQ